MFTIIHYYLILVLAHFSTGLFNFPLFICNSSFNIRDINHIRNINQIILSVIFLTLILLILTFFHFEVLNYVSIGA